MAKQVAKSGLAARLGAAGERAIAAHRDDDVELGAGNLPAGIEGGVAQLKEIKFDTYKEGQNKGQFYFSAMGVVWEPKELNGVAIEGEQTRIGPEPLCETPKAQGKRKTLADHMGWVMNELRKLGVDTTDLKAADLEAVIKDLKEEQPFFKFRTWRGRPTKQFPDPRTQHQWRGVYEYNGEAVEGVADNTEEAVDGEVVESEAEVEEEVVEEDAEDYAALGEAADGGDDEAVAALTEAADAACIDHTALETWSEVAEALEAGGEEAEAEGDEETEEIMVPTKGETCQYKPPKSRKLIDCEVTAVFEAKETCSLKNLDDNKTIYKGVPWDKLVWAE